MPVRDQDVGKPKPSVAVIAGLQDLFASEVEAEIVRRGWSVKRFSGTTAARSFSARVDKNGMHIRPLMPLFIRASAWQSAFEEKQSADAQFLANEAFGMLWAVAAKMQAPVINRPTSAGFVGRMTASQLQRYADGSAVACEYHSSDCRLLDHVEGTVWAEETNGRSGNIRSLPPGTPVRARVVAEAVGYEFVTVVGSRAFRATRDRRSEEAQLSNRSVAIARDLQIHFATIIWEANGSVFSPVRLEAQPEPWQLGPCLSEAAASIVSDLLA